MNEKIVSLLLICLVALSIVYCSSGTALCSNATQSIDEVPSKSTTVTEDPRQDLKLSYPEPDQHIDGDPIDDPKPHGH